MNSMTKYLIILDAGHGEETPGKRSPVWPDGRQLFEHEFNLDIVKRIIEAGLPADILEIRPDGHDKPLKERVSQANAWYRRDNGFEKTLYVSVHANAGGGTGWEVFTSEGETESDKYATIFFEEMEKEFPDMPFRKDISDGDVDKESQFYVLRNTSMPAVLTENFFMDTLDPDCEILFSEEGREKIANAHIEAIKRIIKIWENEEN